RIVRNRRGKRQRHSGGGESGIWRAGIVREEQSRAIVISSGRLRSRRAQWHLFAKRGKIASSFHILPRRLPLVDMPLIAPIRQVLKQPVVANLAEEVRRQW